MRTEKFNLEMQTRESLRMFANHYFTFKTKQARTLNDTLAYSLIREVHTGEEIKIKALDEFYEHLKSDKEIARNFMRVKWNLQKTYLLKEYQEK